LREMGNRARPYTHPEYLSEVELSGKRKGENFLMVTWEGEKTQSKDKKNRSRREQIERFRARNIS